MFRGKWDIIAGMEDDFRALEFRNGELVLIDQRLLPGKLEYVSCQKSEEVAYAISAMIVRGAPAIGGAAGFGVYLAAREARGDFDLFSRKAEHIKSARPTAVNLAWAVDEMVREAREHGLDEDILLKKAESIAEEDIRMNHEIARHGQKVIPQNANILTHCNSGALATCGWGTALGVIKKAHFDGKNIFVYADETRPRLQGARLTAWELVRSHIPSKLIPDSAAASLIKDGKIDLVILGADRITTNGDVANKLGTLALSIICKEYGIPFYVAAPTTTIDFSMKEGKDIVIEERSQDEVKMIEGILIAPEEIEAYNPAFDVTPHENITAIITEKGIAYPPFDVSIEKIKNGKGLQA